ncbi:MAG: hypothetical protein EOP88_15210 [Verrucomicrobiaceae bacterium]|nr:MAG: hypothetical protein EOP88_15210 [Verrucomicrobiaceae bacterium]
MITLKTHPSGRILRAALPLLSLLLAVPLSATPIRVLPWDEQVASMRLAFVGASDSQEIQAMHPTKRTKTYEVTAGDEGIAVEVVGKKTPDGKPCREKLVIPENSRRPLLLVLPDGKSVSGIRLHVIEDDESNFPWGSTRLVNATGRKLVFVAEKKAIEVPATWTPVTVDPVGSERNMEVKLFFRENREKSFYSAVWQYEREVRTLVFLVPGTDARLGPVAMKMIPEDRRLLEKDATAAGR